MAFIKDLEVNTYLSNQCDVLLAIGWLALGKDFPTGEVSEIFFQKLQALMIDPWQPVAAAGLHECELCQFNPPRFGKNLYVPFKGNIYSAPEGVIHYIAQHWYRPPDVFIDAVLNCPDMKSMDYKKAILSNGGRPLLS